MYFWKGNTYFYVGFDTFIFSMSINVLIYLSLIYVSQIYNPIKLNCPSLNSAHCGVGVFETLVNIPKMVRNMRTGVDRRHVGKEIIFWINYYDLKEKRNWSLESLEFNY